MNRRLDELRMRVAIEEAELAALQARNRRLAEENTSLGLQRVAREAERSATEREIPLPMIRRIEGYAGTRRATLVIEGASYVVETGDRIPGNRKVRSVDRDGVTLESDNGAVMRLRIGTTPPSVRAETTTQTSPTLRAPAANAVPPPVTAR